MPDHDVADDSVSSSAVGGDVLLPYPNAHPPCASPSTSMTCWCSWCRPTPPPAARRAGSPPPCIARPTVSWSYRGVPPYVRRSFALSSRGPSLHPEARDGNATGPKTLAAHISSLFRARPLSPSSGRKNPLVQRATDAAGDISCASLARGRLFHKKPRRARCFSRGAYQGAISTPASRLRARA